MPGFTKLYNTIVTSSVWSEDDKTRILWITLLASADAKGFVDGTIPGMAALARISVDDAAKGIRKLESPDAYSRTADNDGRRIKPIEGGWLILNYARYRERRDPEKRREQNREAQRRYRERHRKPRSKPCKPNISPRQKAEDRSKKTASSFVPPTPQELDDYAQSIGYDRPNLGRDFVQNYRDAEPPWHKINGEPVLNWKLTVQAWRRRDERRAAGGNGDGKPREPQRGDPDWLPTGEQADEALRAGLAGMGATP